LGGSDYSMSFNDALSTGNNCGHEIKSKSPWNFIGISL
jgi:hypothetical protein